MSCVLCVCTPAELFTSISPSAPSLPSTLSFASVFFPPTSSNFLQPRLTHSATVSASLSQQWLVVFFLLISFSPMHVLSSLLPCSSLSSLCSSGFHLDLPSCLRRTELDRGRARCVLPRQVLSSVVSLIACNEPACFGFEQCAMCHTAEAGVDEGGGGKKRKW